MRRLQYEKVAQMDQQSCCGYILIMTSGVQHYSEFVSISLESRVALTVDYVKYLGC